MKGRQLCHSNQLNDLKGLSLLLQLFTESCSLKGKVQEAHKYAFHCASQIMHDLT